MNEIYDVAILGAGLAGLGMAAQLKKVCGESSFVVLEKANSVGGTWRDNTYPGAACDVRSHLYWYSFDQPDWSHLYSPQVEILAKINDFVKRNGLAPHIRCNAEVVEALWNEADNYWQITTMVGQPIRARVLITAWGQLNRPSFGGIGGRELFQGLSFHSSRWRHDVSLAGKRVGSIGNAASGVQFIPEIALQAAHLTVFQRSPNYIVPRGNRVYSQDERKTFCSDPSTFAQSRESIYLEHETWHGAMRPGSDVANAFVAMARAHLEAQVADPALRERLWPDYAVGCKRILISDDFYPALARPNVSLVTEKIGAVEAEGVRMVDGHLHELDVIVFATGFESLSFLGGTRIWGHKGISLGETWKNGPQAYNGMTIPGFPNFFMLYGPNTNLGHNSVLMMLECQFQYIIQALQVLRVLPNGCSLSVRENVYANFNQKLQQDLDGSSWSSNCSSWYKNAQGKIVNNWPGSVEQYKQQTAKFETADYELSREDRQHIEAAPQPSP
jgi:cation diffusion facilitator CzcD-associated flavoprotein CzcO